MVVLCSFEGVLVMVKFFSGIYLYFIVVVVPFVFENSNTCSLILCELRWVCCFSSRQTLLTFSLWFTVLPFYKGRCLVMLISLPQTWNSLTQHGIRSGECIKNKDNDIYHVISFLFTRSYLKKNKKVKNESK